MPFEGLHTVLAQLKQTHWQDQQSFERLVGLWPSLVGTVVAAQTRPTKLSAQGVLHIAASSGAWAQNLAFERVRIMAKVNAIWQPPVQDIYFSTREWHQSPQPLLRRAEVLKLTPIKLSQGGSDVRPLPKDAKDAFARWSQVVRQRAAGGYTPCPQCECPTPPEELKRWNCCALCACRPKIKGVI
jgi:predicted nucleic acid-binding Zn ribbon protein